MKKFQVPVLGGMRKMILPPSTTPGTTIAELGASTISLAQLSALVTAQQAAQANSGGGNIGDGTEAFLSVGPGLAGGGPMLGNVNLRLTIPSALIAEDGADGDIGPVGPVGAVGPQGPQGVPGVSGTGSSVAVPMLFQDDTADNDAFGILPMPPPQVLKVLTANSLPISLIQDDVQAEELVPQPGPSATGNLNVNGFLQVYSPGNGFAGNQVIGGAGANASLSVSGNNSVNFSQDVFMFAATGGAGFAGVHGVGPYTLQVNGTNIFAISSGGASLLVGNIGGSGSTNFAYTIGANPLASVTSGGFISLFGSTSAQPNTVSIGANNAAVAVFTPGLGTIAGAISLSGATPPVTAGQTALGITTTNTVITTASGIALPTLASTFWVVNVNGVRYGIPCFAL